MIAPDAFGEPRTGSTPTEAHQAAVALLSGVLLEVARRRQDELPGLVETLQDDVLLTTGGTSRPAYGWFAEGVWRYGERRVHELFLNADRRVAQPMVSAAEDVLVTLLHEGCHVWAQANDIRDVSRGGRYHNRRFAEIALQIGLDVERDPVIGHRTSSLSSWARAEYADLLSELDAGLVLAREPAPVKRADDDTEQSDQPGMPTDSSGLPAPSPKYVFASCQCSAGRSRLVTIRVAAGSWRPGAIRCGICQAPFMESLTSRRQSRQRHGR